MRDDTQLITSGIAQDAQNSPEFKRLANKGLIDFLREQIVDAEWKIARARTEIAAYEAALALLDKDAAAANPQ
jgi:hypothetical protein